MTWRPYYHGDGKKRLGVSLRKAPPWRSFAQQKAKHVFQPPEGLVEIVNAALHLRRPLLITGEPGSGKSSVIDSVAMELGLGEVLRWHITSRSTLTEALYRYDVLGRISAQQLAGESEVIDISPYLQLGPLGTALLPLASTAGQPRALLIDEIDKGDLDLAGDLLDVLERGEFEVPELARMRAETVNVRRWDSESPNDTTAVPKGKVICTEFPFIVMTSNGERDFPAPFLRRCIRYTMPPLNDELLRRIVTAHLNTAVADSAQTGELITRFIEDLKEGKVLAVDQLLNAVFLLNGTEPPTDEARKFVLDSLLHELSRN